MRDSLSERLQHEMAEMEAYFTFLLNKEEDYNKWLEECLADPANQGEDEDFGLEPMPF